MTAKERYSFTVWICFTGMEVNRVLRKRKEKNLDRTYAICKRRKVKIKYLGNTTNMRQHLQRFHPATENAPPPVPAQQRTIPETVTKLPKNSEKACRITRAIGLFIGTDLQPYSVEKNRAFRKILLARSTSTRRTYFASKEILKIYSEVKEKVNILLANLLCSVMSLSSCHYVCSCSATNSVSSVMWIVDLCEHITWNISYVVICLFIRHSIKYFVTLTLKIISIWLVLQ